MHITGIEKLPRKKNKVYIDGEYAFMLYDRDLAVYHLDGFTEWDEDEDPEISDNLYDRILKETVIRRAHQKALALLERMDRSEAELRRKLKLDMYPDAVTDETIQWVRQQHYLDDARYAQSYIRGRIGNSSRQEIMSKLRAKGIDKDIIEEAYMICSEELNVHAGRRNLCGNSGLPDDDAGPSDPEQEAAVRMLAKKLGSGRNITPKEQRSAMGYMLRKGFRHRQIIEAFRSLGLETEYGMETEYEE